MAKKKAAKEAGSDFVSKHALNERRIMPQRRSGRPIKVLENVMKAHHERARVDVSDFMKGIFRSESGKYIGPVNLDDVHPIARSCVTDVKIVERVNGDVEFYVSIESGVSRLKALQDAAVLVERMESKGKAGVAGAGDDEDAMPGRPSSAGF